MAVAQHKKHFVGPLALLLGCCFSLPVFGQSLNDLFLRLNQADSIAYPHVYADIGQWYSQTEVHGKSIEYLQKAYELGRPQFSHLQNIGILQGIGRQYEILDDYSNAFDAYTQVLSYALPQNRAKYLEDLSRTAARNNNPSEALKYRLELMQAKQLDGQALPATFLEQVATLYGATGQYALANAYFEQAIRASKSLKEQQHLLVAQAANYVKAHELDKAQQIISQLKAGNSEGQIELHHATPYSQLAFVAYSLGKYQDAIDYSQQALRKDMPGHEDQPLQIQLYKLLKAAHESLQQYKQAVAYSERYLLLVNAYALEQRERRQQFLQREVEAERQEGIIRDFIAQQQQQASSLTQEKLEREKKERELVLREKELALLKNQQALQETQLEKQRLERERIEQRLRFSEQQTLTETQKREAEQQALNAKEQRLLAEKAEAERIRQQKALEVVKKEQALQQNELEQQRSKQLYSYLLLGLAGAVVILLIGGYRSSQKARKVLQAKSEEVLRHNDALQQAQLALQAQRDATAEKNKELEEKSATINSSLNYAMNIQGAILPNPSLINKHFSGHFVIYRPKDVVSGDFYWLEQLPDQSLVIASVDCTGHGIPGAFMSMIGHTLMNEIILSENIHTPEGILEELHQKVRLALHQDITNNRDGMDCCICRIFPANEQGIYTAVYAGARIPLYYSTNNDAVEMLSPTKRSIGGEQFTDRTFEEHRITLPSGSRLYLSTDGIVDQSNPERKRFGKGKLKNTLDGAQALDIAAQRQAIEQALEKHQQHEAQRDDITLVGLQLA